MATYYCKYCSIRSSVRAMDGTHLCIDHFLKYSDEQDEVTRVRNIALTLKNDMDIRISTYIAHCTGVDITDIDYSAIDEAISDTIKLMGGEPAQEDEEL